MLAQISPLLDNLLALWNFSNGRGENQKKRDCCWGGRKLVEASGKSKSGIERRSWVKVLSRPAVASSQRLEAVLKWNCSAAGFNKLGVVRRRCNTSGWQCKRSHKKVSWEPGNVRVVHVRRAPRQQVLPKGHRGGGSCLKDTGQNMMSVNSTFNHIQKRLFGKEKKEKNGQRNNQAVKICGCSCPQRTLTMLAKPKMYHVEPSGLQAWTDWQTSEGRGRGGGRD